MADIDGGVIYAIGFDAGSKHRTIDGGLSKLTEAGSDATPPTIDNFSPAVGTPIERNTPISFDVTDASGLQRVMVLVQLRGDLVCVHDGERFRGNFTNYSSRVSIADGWRYTVRPNGGWTSAPSFELLAYDTDGNEAP